MIASVAFEQLESWALGNSLWAAGVAVLVFAAQRVIGPGVSARWRHNLWLLVVARLVLPPIPALQFAIPRPPSAATAQHGIETAAQPTESASAGKAELSGGTQVGFEDPKPVAMPDLERDDLVRAESSLSADRRVERRDLTVIRGATHSPMSANTNAATPARISPAPARGSVLNALFLSLLGRLLRLAWFVGTAGLLARLVFSSLRLTRTVRRLPPISDAEFCRLVADCCRTMNVRRPPRLLESPPGAGPALVGAFRPKLLLPSGVLRHFGRRELRLIVLHELAHLKRRDVALNYVLIALQAVHWFNPLVWLAFRRLRAEREVACDEAVLRASPAREAGVYGSMIVSLLELLSRGAVPAGAMGVVQHQALMQRRITMIAKFDSRRRTHGVRALLLSVCVAGLAVSGLRAQQAPPNPQPQAEKPGDRAPDQPAPAGSLSADEAGARSALEQASGNPPAPTADTAPRAAGGPTVGNGLPGVGPVGAAAPPPESVTASPPGAIPPTPVPAYARPTTPTVLPTAPVDGDVTERRDVLTLEAPGAVPRGAVLAGAAPPERIDTVEDAADAQANRQTRQKLELEHPFTLDAIPLNAALSELAHVGEVDFVIDNGALEDAKIDVGKPMSIRVERPLPIEQVLRLMLRVSSGDRLDYSIEHGVVFISTRHELARHRVTRVYDLNGLGNPRELSYAVAQRFPDASADLQVVGHKLLLTTSEPEQRQVEKLLGLLRGSGDSAQGIYDGPSQDGLPRTK